MEFRPKTAISLDKCAMITIVFFDPMSDFAKFIPQKELVYKLTQNYTVLHAIECKEGLCISRLVDFELLFELKFEQKKGTTLHTPRYKAVSSLKQSVRGQYICPSQLYILDIACGSTWTLPLEFFPEKVDMLTTSTTDRLARATEDVVAILQQPHPATPFLQQGTIVNDAMKQLTKIFSPPNRNETAMAAPSPRVLETDTSAPRVDENNNNSSNQPPRVVETTTTALDQLRNRLRNNL
jgi:hypothetical protein